MVFALRLIKGGQCRCITGGYTEALAADSDLEPPELLRAAQQGPKVSLEQRPKMRASQRTGSAKSVTVVATA